MKETTEGTTKGTKAIDINVMPRSSRINPLSLISGGEVIGIRYINGYIKYAPNIHDVKAYKGNANRNKKIKNIWIENNPLILEHDKIINY